MQEIQSANQAYLVRSELLPEPPDACFDPAFWQQAGRVIGSARGRGTTWFVRGEKLEMALRHYRRGGLFGKLVEDAYWFCGWRKTRCAEEIALLDKLVRGGVRVPRPVAARAIRNGLVYRADILVEKIAEAKDLVGILQHQALPEAIWHAVGAMVRRMHDLQVCHTDLNSHNILLDSQQQIWLIDFDKCYEQAGDAWKAKKPGPPAPLFCQGAGQAGGSVSASRAGRHCWQATATLKLLA